MKKEVIHSPLAPDPIGPYSQAIKIGDMLYVSGQMPFDQVLGKMISGSVVDEAHQVMKNLQAILNAAEMNFSHVVKCSIFLKNMSDFASVNEVYGTYFQKTPPARETVEVSALPKGVNVEISCIAVA